MGTQPLTWLSSALGVFKKKTAKPETKWRNQAGILYEHSARPPRISRQTLPLKDNPRSGDTDPWSHWSPRRRRPRPDRLRDIQPEYPKAAGLAFGRRHDDANFLTKSYCLPQYVIMDFLGAFPSFSVQALSTLLFVYSGFDYYQLQYDELTHG